MNWLFELPWFDFLFGILLTWLIVILFRKCGWRDLIEGLFVIGLLKLLIILDGSWIMFFILSITIIYWVGIIVLGIINKQKIGYVPVKKTEWQNKKYDI